jgi:hypothetical protein
LSQLKTCYGEKKGTDFIPAEGRMLRARRQNNINRKKQKGVFMTFKPHNRLNNQNTLHI